MKGIAGALEYLYSLEKFGMVFGLENIEWILGLIGNPERHLKTVHIAGTNGKGSVASILSRMLREEGYRVGVYTSPHLRNFTERIVINGAEISEEEVIALTNEIREGIERADKDRRFTFFDFTTAMAIAYFSRQEADVSVMETGLGGRLDSTNVVNPLVSVITNVDYDHMDYLGNDLKSIAREKAGIVKAGVPVVTGAQGEALEVIEEASAKKGSPLYVLGRDFGYKKDDEQAMTYWGPDTQLKNLRLGLRGDHQFGNCALALCVAGCLARSGFHVGEPAMRRGIELAQWPGRLEVVHEEPTVLLDAAHNPHGIRALKEYIADRYGEERKILVFGVMRDKDYGTMLPDLAPLFEDVILTRPDIERALPPQDLSLYASGAVIAETVEEALTKAGSLAGDRGLIVVTGSIYTIGEARSIIDRIF